MSDKDLNYKLKLDNSAFTKGMSDAVSQTGKLDSRMTGLKSSIAGAIGGVALGAGAIGFGKAVIESLKNYEYFSASLRVLMKGDKNAVTALQGQLVDLAKTTPFSLTDVQESSKKLLAYGFGAGEVVNQMRMLGDVSAATGNQIGDVAYLYGTLRTQGKAMSKDIYQFTNRGINIIPQLAKQFGILESQVMDYASMSKISFKDVEKAFTSMTSKGGDFFGMMNEQSKTIGGRLSNMGDAWEQLKVNIGRSQTGIIASTVGWANEMLNSFNNVIAQMNRMDDAFSKANVKGYGMLENFYNWIGRGTTNDFYNKNFSGGKGKMEMFDRSIQKMYVDPSGKDKLSATQSLRDVLKLKVGYGKSFTNKEISKDEYDKSMALLEQAQGTIKGNLALFDKKGLKGTQEQNEILAGGNASGHSAGKTGSLGSSTEISGAKPQSIIINITKLIESLNLSTTNLTESASKIKEEVAKALLEAVNDVNTLARTT